MTLSSSPPPELLEVAIDAAIAAARMSPCAKSKRGAAVFKRRPIYAPTAVIGTGFNGQPEPFRCNGTEWCREHCGKLCEHAEARAIRTAIAALSERMDLGGGLPAVFAHYDLVHIKVQDGRAVGGGPPSCWQCSREVLAVGLGGVWLYEETTTDRAPPYRSIDVWKRYSAADFHAITLANCNIVQPPPLRMVP